MIEVNMKHLAILILLSACNFIPDPVVPEPTDDVVELCALACSNMQKLDCPGWEGSAGEDDEYGTADDVSCEAVCIDIENNGTDISLHPGCVAVASSCEKADECFVE